MVFGFSPHSFAGGGAAAVLKNVPASWDTKADLKLVNSTPSWDGKNTLTVDRQPLWDSQNNLTVTNNSSEWTTTNNYEYAV